MEPHSHASAPSLDLGVERRLRRLDRQLRATWSPYSVDSLTGQVIEHCGRPVEDPCWHLWRKDECSTHHFYVMPIGEYFGHEQVARLERDVARHMSPDEILRRHRARAEDRKALELRRKEEAQQDKIKANESRIADLVFGGKSGRRDGKVFSYPGQKSHATPGTVMKDAKEDGWELPDPQ